jgi:hypothetical protein
MLFFLDRPAEMVKRQKIQEPPVKKPLPNPASKPVVSTPEPYIPSLMPGKDKPDFNKAMEDSSICPSYQTIVQASTCFCPSDFE